MILYVLAAIILLLFFISLFLPSKYTFENAILVNAPSTAVYPLVLDYRNWEKWDPWVEADKNMKIVYEGVPGVGYKRMWKSKTQGNGSMEIVEAETNKRIKGKLLFQNSGKPAWDNWFFNNTKDGLNIIWKVEIETGINPVGKYMFAFTRNMMNRHFMKGLENLKKLAESEPVFPEINVLEQPLPSQKYIGIKKTISSDPAEIMKFMSESFNTIMNFLEKNKIGQMGPRASFYFSFDEEKKLLEVMPALPVPFETRVKLPDEMEYYETKEGKNLMVIHTGAYDNLPQAWNALEQYVKKKNLTMNGAPYEIFLTDPLVEKDTSSWQTQVIFPIK